MTGGSGHDRRGANGGKPLKSNPRSENGKTANAPKKDIVIVTTAEGVAQRIVTVDSQAGQTPGYPPFVYNRYGGFSAGKYAATYDHGMDERTRTRQTSSGSSGGAIVVSSPARSKVSATPPPQQQSTSEFKQPTDSTSKSKAAKSSTSKAAASAAKGPANIVRPTGLVYVDSRGKSASQLKSAVKTEPIPASTSLVAVEAVLSTLADEGDFQSDVKPEPTPTHQTRTIQSLRDQSASRRSSAAPLSAAQSTSFQMIDTSTAMSGPVLQQYAPTRQHAPSAGSFDYPSQSASVQHQHHQRHQHIHRSQAHAASSQLASFSELSGGLLRPSPQAHAAPAQSLAESFARSIGVTQQPPAVGYYDGSRQAQSGGLQYTAAMSDVASGSQRHMFVHPTHHQQQLAHHQQQSQSMDTDTLYITTHPSSSSFDYTRQSSSSLGHGGQSSSVSYGGGDGGEDPVLASIKRLMAEANERMIQYERSRQQQAQPQQYQFPAPLPHVAASDVDELLEEEKRNSPEDFAYQPRLDDDPVYNILKEGDGSEYEGSGGDLLAETSPEIPAELERMSDGSGENARYPGIFRGSQAAPETYNPGYEYRNPDDRLTVDNLHALARTQNTSVRLLLSERSHIGATARQQVKRVIKQPDGSFVGDSRYGGVESAFESEETQKARQHDSEQQRATDRARSSRKRKIGQPSPPDRTTPSKQFKTEAPDDGDLMTAADALTILRAKYEGRYFGRPALDYLELTHRGSQLVSLHTLETVIKIELRRFDTGWFVLKAEPESVEQASAHSDSEADESDADSDYQQPGRKHQKRSVSSIGSSSVQGDVESVVDPSKGKKRAPVYKDGDLDANKDLVFTNNKFADKEYSDCEAGLEDWPDHISRGKPPSGGSFPTLHLTHNTNYATAQMYELVGHSKAEIKKIEQRIRASVEPQLTALQHRRFHVSDPRHRNNEGSRQFASIIKDPKTWKLDAPLRPGVHQPRIYSHVQKPKQGVKTKEPWHQTKEQQKAAKFRGFKFTFEKSEARHFKGYDQAKKLNPTVICPATVLQTIPGLPSFYRLIHSLADIKQAFKVVDCTPEVIGVCFARSSANLRTMTLLINGDVEVEKLVINGVEETEAAAKKRVVKEIKQMLTAHAKDEDIPRITLSDNLKFHVWKKDAPVNLVHRDLWPWLEECCQKKQIFTRFTDLPFDVISEDQIGMCFDQTNRHSLLSFTLGVGSEYALPHSNIALNAGVLIHAGANPARLPSHHYCTSGAFVEYLLGDEEEVVKRMKAGPYKKEFETCARYDQHHDYLFNPDILGLKYVVGIRRPGQMTTVLGGGFRMCLSFGAAESIGVDWLSAPASWLVIEKPLLSDLYCTHNAANHYVEDRKHWFEGAFNACTTMQDPGAKLFRDTINSCYGCLQEPDPDVDAETWRGNHTRPFKTGTIPRGNTCTNPIGHFPKSKRELLAAVAGLKSIKTEAADAGDDADDEESDKDEQVANEGEQEGAKEPVDGAPGVELRPTEGAPGVELRPTEGAPGVELRPTEQKETEAKTAEEPEPKIVKQEKRTPAKDKTKAKGQEEMPEKKVEVTTGEAGSSGRGDLQVGVISKSVRSAGAAPIPPPRKKKLTKAQLQQQKEEEEARKEEEERNQPLHHSVDPALSDVLAANDDETSGGDKLAIVMETEDGGELQTEDTKAVTEPTVGDPSNTVEHVNGGDQQNGGVDGDPGKSDASRDLQMEVDGDDPPKPKPVSIVAADGTSDDGGENVPANGGEHSADAKGENDSGEDTDAASSGGELSENEFISNDESDEDYPANVEADDEEEGEGE